MRNLLYIKETKLMPANFQRGTLLQYKQNPGFSPYPIMATFLFIMMLLFSCGNQSKVEGPTGSNVLVFTKTQAFRHECIEPGVKAMRDYFSKYKINLTQSEDSTMFTSDKLKPFDAVVFFQTTGNVLGDEGQGALQQYIQSGKGFVGIHSASDTEYDWGWYTQLLGAQFANHADIQTGVVIKSDSCKIACQHLPARWTRTDEWYNFKQPPTNVHVELLADETTYTGGLHANHHPLAWYHNFEGGRAYYTALGHTVENYQDTLLLEHLARAVIWASKR